MVLRVWVFLLSFCLFVGFDSLGFGSFAFRGVLFVGFGFSSD